MIDYRLDEGVAEIVLNAPTRRNALGLDDLRELGSAYERAESDGARAVLLRGEGPSFCAGRDTSRASIRRPTTSAATSTTR